MSNATTDTASAKVETTEAVSTTTESKQDTTRRGPRGDVGPHNVKGLYHSFLRQGRKNHGVSLKDFARRVVADNVIPEEVELVKAWFFCKRGDNEKAAKALREKNKGATLAAIRLASKNARRGKK